MNVYDLFKILSEHEKELMCDICEIWKKEENNKLKKIRKENEKILLELSDNKITQRLLKALLDYYGCNVVNKEIMLKHIYLKNVRNIGEKRIVEFNNLFKK